MGCPLGALKGEHVKGRQLVAELESATAAYSANKEDGCFGLIQALQSLIALYPAHIWKEDYLLFPMATKVVSDEDDALLMEQFAVAESGFDSNAHDNYEALVEDLTHLAGG